MNELRWASGELCKVGDAVKHARGAARCTGLLHTSVGLEWETPNGDREWAQEPHLGWTLLRRAGEAEDRDREEYEYWDDGTTPDFDSGWQMIVATPSQVFRRLRQPAAPELAPRGLCASGGGHVFLFSTGGSGERCPDGLLCRCGRLRARWVLCPCCGQARFVGEPVPETEQP
jgi:hypothetical protein